MSKHVVSELLRRPTMTESCVERYTWFRCKQLYVQCHCNVNTWTYEHPWQFLVASSFWTWQLLRTALHTRHSTVTSCARSSCVASQPLYWLMDWAWRTNRMVCLHVFFYFCGVGSNKKHTYHNKDTKWTETADYRYFCCCSSSLLKVKCWFLVFQVAAMCEKCRGLFWNTILSGSVWATEWCKNCRNTTFHFVYTSV